MTNEITNEITTEQDKKNEKLFEALMIQDIPNGAQEALENGADINALTNKGASGLSVALSKNKRKSFAWLIKNGVNVDIQDNLGETILMRLARDNKIDFLEYLFGNATPDINLRNSLGISALQYACMNSNEEIAKLLIQKGADVNNKSVLESSPLLSAAQQHNYEIFKELINSGANIHDVDSLKQNVLINLLSVSPNSVKKKDIESINEILKLSVNEGIDINYKAPSGNRAVFVSLMYGQKEATKYLLENDVDLDFSHTKSMIKNCNPLHLSLEAGDVEISDLIMQKLKQKNPKLLEKLLVQPNEENNTPSAFGFFHKKTRQLMIDNNGDVNAVLNFNGQKMPVVLVVIDGNDEAILDAMISKGVKLHFEDDNVAQPIRSAIGMGLPGMVKKIVDNSSIDLNKPIKINDNYSLTPLSFLVSNSKSQILETFLTRKTTIEALLNQKLNDGSGAYAIPEDQRKEWQTELDKYKNIEEELDKNRILILDILIEKGSNVNAADKDGKTAIYYCNDVDSMNLLIEKGADLFHKDNEGNTPLSWAIKNNRKNVIEHLLQHIIENDLVEREEVQNLLIDIMYTADNGYVAQGLLINGLNAAIQEGSGLLNNVDENGNTALMIACATEQSPVAQLLIEKGSDVNLKNNLGETALMHAVAHNDEKIVELLINKGANIKDSANNGYSVLDFAKQVGNKELIELLEAKKERSKKP